MPGQPAVTYTYDALGRRASRTANGSTETYAYVGDQVARIDRGSGNVTDSAIDAMGDRLTVGTAWTLPNVRGDVAGLLNAGQSAISDACRYDPFGVSLDVRGTTTNPYRFGGRLLESASGQYDFGARQYDPAIGAFTSLDSVIGSAQNPISLNRYLYGHANPEVMIDLDGHAATERDSGVGRLQAAVDSATAAVRSAEKTRDDALRDLRAALKSERKARDHVKDLCPRTRCRDGADRGEWRQSRLDTLAAAVAARQSARTRYDAAVDTLSAALDSLEKAEKALAQATKRLLTSTIDDIDAMSSAELKTYLEAWKNPTLLDSNFLYAKCRYAGLDPESCNDYSRQREAGELDGPLGTLLVAPLAAVSASLVLAYLAAHPELLGRLPPPPQPTVQDLLRPGGDPIGAPGGNPLIRNVTGGVDAAKALFDTLARGGTVISNPTYGGILIRLPNGGTIGLRLVSKSGGPVLDINVPGFGDITKIHFQ